MVGKYKKKPIVIEALQWDGDNKEEVQEFVGSQGEFEEYNNLKIKTLEGNMYAPVGSWIIKGIKGEFYPIDKNIFNETYEADE